MNSATHTLPPHQNKSRSPIYTSHIKLSCIFHPVIRLSIQFKIHSNRSLTSSTTNNLTWSHISNYSISPPNKWILYPLHPNHHTRASMTNLSSMTLSNNMIYLNTSRNKLSSI
uniref:Uncharacterized protein n=1 Tax=Bos indicus x Bos taurus TaxID=30522 RepID=A0A4W2GNV3_BOBOX